RRTTKQRQSPPTPLRPRRPIPHTPSTPHRHHQRRTSPIESRQQCPRPHRLPTRLPNHHRRRPRHARRTTNSSPRTRGHPVTTTRHEITYQPLDQLQPHPANPKDHDVGAVIASIHRFGIAGPIIVDQRTGYLLAGHGRVKALKAIRDDGGTPPEGVTVADDPDNAGEWVVPVMDSWASRTDYD